MRKNIFWETPFLFLILFAITVSGCNDSNPINPNTQSVIPLVSGNVISFWGEPKANVKIFTDSASTYTDASGNFTLQNVSSPYNLYLSDSASGQYYVMKNISTENVKFAFTMEPYGQFINTCGLNIIFSSNAFGNISDVKFIFTDGKYLNAYGTPSSGLPTEVRLNGYSSVTGKLYIIGYRQENNKTVAYENFGFKDVTLTSGGQVTVNFDSADIAFNPEETTISGRFINNIPDNIFRVFSLSFGEYNTPNYSTHIAFDNFSLTTDFNYVVPTNIPFPYNPVIFFQSSDQQATKRYLRISVEPGTVDAVFSLASPPNLIDPQEGASNISMNTQFNYTQGTEEGIYIVKISEGLKQFWIYTKDLEITLGSVSKSGFNLNAGTNYKWRVSKIGPYSNLNEFAVNPYMLTQFTSDSESRTFTAEP